MKTIESVTNVYNVLHDFVTVVNLNEQNTKITDKRRVTVSLVYTEKKNIYRP